MAAERVERRLVAILAADVVGYSRLMGEDEEGTLEQLRNHRRDLMDPAIEAHHGRIFKTTGDGALVEFASVVDDEGRKKTAPGTSLGAAFACAAVSLTCP
jgi:adenylate cyclase